MSTAPEWIAAACSIAGAWMVGSTTAHVRLVGFLLFLFSNLLWIVWGVSVSAWPLVAMQFAFLVTSVRGIWSNRNA
jgi:hypothetical protein